MYAFRGDQIIVRGHGSSAARRGEVLSGDHSDGHPPFWVRWSDTGAETLLVPAGTVTIEHAGPTYPPEYDERP